MPSPSKHYDELRKLEERQRAEASQREKEEQHRRQQAASARPDSSHRFDELREIGPRQLADATRERDVASQAQRAADAKSAAEKVEIDRSRTDAARLEQERQTRDVEQWAARSWKAMHEASGPTVAKADVEELHNRAVRHNEQEQRQLAHEHPDDRDKQEKFDQFAATRLEAVYFPHDYLRGKTPEQINELAREGYNAERERETVKPYVNDPSDNRKGVRDASAKDNPNLHSQHDLRAADKGNTAEYHRSVEVRQGGLESDQSAPKNPDDRAHLRPQQATMDTRGFGHSEPRSDPSPPRTGEITDRKANKFALDDSRPKSDAKLLKEASRAYSAEKSAELGRGDEGGHGR